ncbi:hypothetical protein F8388_000544 [Cannabis sativa]|uniref:Uncharacterized protein n=1 Tax=Cannabis sativa TaxID=3483 RepID=A0A7J6F1U0_CANSA|nr:hypothetical protein F8388_000544 [Cannabis sativa]
MEWTRKYGGLIRICKSVHAHLYKAWMIDHNMRKYTRLIDYEITITIDATTWLYGTMEWTRNYGELIKICKRAFIVRMDMEGSLRIRWRY